MYRGLQAILLAAVLWQGLHVLEHSAQVYEAFVMCINPARGLAGEFLDREWMHFIFNAFVLSMMVAIFIGISRPSVAAARQWVYALFTAGMLLQSYHILEHSVKLRQYLTTGIEPAPGILGNYFNLVWLHFWINILVFLSILVGFFGLYAKLRSERPARSAGSRSTDLRSRGPVQGLNRLL